MTPNDIVSLKQQVLLRIPVGSSAAISRRELADSIGCSDRAVRRTIEDLRLDYPICSNNKTGGYYFPEDSPAGRADAREFVQPQTSRALKCLRSKKAVEAWLGEMDPRQQTLFDLLSVDV